MLKNIVFITALAVVCSASAYSHDNHGGGMQRADSHAPISVMGDHTHKSGELMFSYRFMNMNMEGLLKGDERISPSDIILSGDHSGHDHDHGDMRYAAAPEDMDMGMHMIGAMYAPADWITIMAMVNIVDNSMYMFDTGEETDHTGMDHNMGMAVQHGDDDYSGSEMETSGLGDISLSAIFPVYTTDNISISALVGSSIPTGATDLTMQMNHMMNGEMMAMTMLQPYPMQLGAGVAVPFAAINFSQYFDSDDIGFDGSYGAQIRYSQPIGENDQGWAPGSNLTAQAWCAYVPTQNLSLSLRAAFITISEISGGTPEPTLLDGMAIPMSPLAYTENTGRDLLYGGIGANWILPDFGAGTFRLAGEYNLPIFQDVNGIQMREIGTIVIGLQYSPTFEL